jgi:gas vesicle protein
MKENRIFSSTATVFVMGAAIGAGIALLYAPQSGKETRKMLAKKGKQLKNQATDAIESAKEVVVEGKNRIVGLIHNGEVAVNKAKSKLHKLA